MRSKVPLLRARRLSKSFGGRRALIEADLDLWPGEIHGLVGQNGSGKSTLVKILAGYHEPDGDGTLEVNGEAVTLPLTSELSGRLGLCFVHQDLGLFDGGTVVENVRVGRFRTGRLGQINWRHERDETVRLLREFDLDIDPSAEVGALTDVQRAMIAILRAVQRIPSDRPGVLVLDEPTASLPHRNVDQLFATVRAAAQRGHAVVFVSHRLDEVRRLTDDVTVLRDGRVVAQVATRNVTERDLIAHILGVSLDDYYPPAPEAHELAGDPVLEAIDIGRPGLNPFSFRARRGEIIGLTGLLGMPHEHLPYALFGVATEFSGVVAIDGQRIPLHEHSPRRAMDAGVALLPANRLRNGGVAAATVRENVTLATLPTYFRRGRLDHGLEDRSSRALLDRFDVVPRDPAAAFGTLSGGNQQKALVGKWFAREPKVFLMHEPTQGVDVGAKRQILEHMREAADRGTTLVVATAEYEDLAHMCDRAIVFRRHEEPIELRGAGLTKERLIEQCYR